MGTFGGSKLLRGKGQSKYKDIQENNRNKTRNLDCYINLRSEKNGATSIIKKKKMAYRITHVVLYLLRNGCSKAVLFVNSSKLLEIIKISIRSF